MGPPFTSSVLAAPRTVSIRAMTWSWLAPIPPTLKFVLLALADIADDDGVSWPRHRSVASKCSETVRTVQRTIAALQSHGHILIEPRYRHDGSRSSNRYRLPIETPHDKLSRGDDAGVVGSLTPTSWHPDTGVGTRTTKEPSLDTPRLRKPAVVGNAVVDNSSLIFPVRLTASQRAAIGSQLTTLAQDAAQQILDELAGRMQGGEIKNPVGYAGTLIRSARNGLFVPEMALVVADARERHEEHVRQRAEQDAEALRVLREMPVKLPEPFREAINRMQQRDRKPQSDTETGSQ